MFNKHFLWLFQNVSILTEPGTNHDASLFLRATSLSCRTIFTGRNRRFPCCIRPDQNTPGQTKAPFSPRNAEKRVQVNVFTWPCRNRHSPVRSPQALSSEKLRSAVRSEVLDGTNHLRGVGVLVVVPRHDLDLVGVVVATLVFRTLFVVVPNFETTVTVPQRTVVVPNTACSYHYYTTFHRYFQVFLVSFSGGIFMRAIAHILIRHPSESPGPGGLRRGVCPAQVLSSVRDLAALRGNLGLDFMGVSRYQMAV